MHTKIEHVITIVIDEDETLELTPKQFVELHDKMTTMYNENYDLISEEANAEWHENI